jgi:hypothetical protein
MRVDAAIANLDALIVLKITSMLSFYEQQFVKVVGTRKIVRAMEE